MVDLMAALEASLAAAKAKAPKAKSRQGAPRRQGVSPQRVDVADAAVEVDVEGRRSSSSPTSTRSSIPTAGFTKGQVIDYYTRIAPGAAAPPAGAAADAEALPQRRRRASSSTRRLPEAPAGLGADGAGAERAHTDDHRLLPGRRPAHAGVGGEPGRPRAAHLAVARRATSSARRWWCSTSIPGAPADDRRVRPGGALAARAARRPRARERSRRRRARRACRSTCRSTRRPPTTRRKPFAQALAQLLEQQHPKLVVSQHGEGAAQGQGAHRLEPERPSTRPPSASTRCGRASGPRSRRR